MKVFLISFFIAIGIVGSSTTLAVLIKPKTVQKTIFIKTKKTVIFKAQPPKKVGTNKNHLEPVSE